MCVVTSSCMRKPADDDDHKGWNCGNGRRNQKGKPGGATMSVSDQGRNRRTAMAGDFLATLTCFPCTLP
ncbi:hypothetical protein CGRA01v4_06326 [Colletotrichum graminicola]|nr:hypothetical protein CGRA01v4_06326 [Colletotrichum graminicola]